MNKRENLILWCLAGIFFASGFGVLWRSQLSVAPKSISESEAAERARSYLGNRVFPYAYGISNALEHIRVTRMVSFEPNCSLYFSVLPSSEGASLSNNVPYISNVGPGKVGVYFTIGGDFEMEHFVKAKW